MSPQRTIRTAVKRYLEDRAGSSCYVADMEAPLQMTKKQIQSAVYGLIKYDGDPVDVISAGNAWRWELVKRGDKMVPARAGSRLAPVKMPRPLVEDETREEDVRVDDTQEEIGSSVIDTPTLATNPAADDAHSALSELIRQAAASVAVSMATRGEDTAPPARFVSYRVIAERDSGEIIGQAATDADDGFYVIRPI